MSKKILAVIIVTFFLSTGCISIIKDIKHDRDRRNHIDQFISELNKEYHAMTVVDAYRMITEAQIGAYTIWDDVGEFSQYDKAELDDEGITLLKEEVGFITRGQHVGYIGTLFDFQFFYDGMEKDWQGPGEYQIKPKYYKTLIDRKWRFALQETIIIEVYKRNRIIVTLCNAKFFNNDKIARNVMRDERCIDLSFHYNQEEGLNSRMYELAAAVLRLCPNVDRISTSCPGHTFNEMGYKLFYNHGFDISVSQDDVVKRISKD